MKKTTGLLTLALGLTACLMSNFSLLEAVSTHSFDPMAKPSQADAGADPRDLKNGSQWMPSASALFPQLKADPRQPRMALAFRFDDKTFHTNVGSANLGGDLPIWIGSDIGCFDELQFGLQAAVWACFDMKSTSMEFINSDWYAGIPVYARTGDTRWRFRVYHISSHLGDEYMLTHQINNFSRENPSMEATDITAYQPIWNEQLFGYVTAGLIINSDVTYRIRHSYFNVGAEYYWAPIVFQTPALKAEPYAAIHTMWWENNNFQPDVNVAMGLTWCDSRSGRHQMATSLEYYTGHSQEGQFGRLRTQYVCMQLTFIP